MTFSTLSINQLIGCVKGCLLLQELAEIPKEKIEIWEKNRCGNINGCLGKKKNARAISKTFNNRFIVLICERIDVLCGYCNIEVK